LHLLQKLLQLSNILSSCIVGSMAEIANSKADFLLSTDTLSGYGLDIIFDLAKSAWFQWLDLCVRKSFDARNAKYIKKLTKKYDLPVRIVQTSNSVNAKELNQALDLCEVLWARIISINAPRYLDIRAYNFILDNLANYKKHNQDIKFTIVNPSDENFFALPIPKYHFKNIVEIIKKYGCYLWLDIANLNQDILEWEFLRKIDKFVPHTSAFYISDKTKLGRPHVVPWEGILKLQKIFSHIKKQLFEWYFSLKIDIEKSDLTDVDRALLILQKTTAFYKNYYVDIEVEVE